MSTLTKILIVLLTLSSIFLCGIVVTYVATADNFKQQNKIFKTRLDAAKENEKSAKRQLSENIAKSQQLQDKLKNEIASLKVEFTELQAKLDEAEREKAGLLQKVNSWTSITKDFYQTTDKQGQLLKNTLEELNRVQAEQIKERRQLNETTTAFVEKMAIIKTLETERKQLLEEKSELQSKLDQLLLPLGEAVAAPVAVTQKRDTARPAMLGVRDIALQGLVTKVDLKNSMASISIGSADGVKEGMKFHVTRGDKFLCDILIIDVDAEEAVGVLELVQQQPKVGDSVSTNL